MSEEIREAKIVALKARNIKRLQAVEIHPAKGESMVVVGGENAQGKTSVLDSIMYALAGGKAIPDDVVRHGEKKGEIELDLGELKIVRVLGKGAKLEVKAKDGEKLASPQTILDRLAGKLTFDPLRFQRLSETPAGRREQADILKELLGLDFSEEEKAKKILFDKRTDANRDLKRMEMQVAELPFYPGLPEEKINLIEATEKLGKAVRHNEEHLKKKVVLDNIKQELEELAKRKSELIAQKVSIAKELLGFEPIDIDAMREKLSTAEETNEKINQNLSRQKLNEQVSELSKKAEGLTDKLEAIEKKKQKALNKAEMPVQGLNFTEDGVLFNDVPFHNCSSAEQLKLSVAMGIKMNPALKIMLIRDGSLLDDNSLETLREMASESGHQVWLERVGKGEECTVVIEDGAVVQ